MVEPLRALPRKRGGAGGRAGGDLPRAVAPVLPRALRGDEGGRGGGSDVHPPRPRRGRRPHRRLPGPALALARAPLEGAPRTIVADDAFLESLARAPDRFEARTASSDMAMYQYTSGTTRALPEAVRHRHRAIVTVLIAALYATGVRPGDRFCCPSSPAWGHGLWHGTLGPLALGAEITAWSGRFDPERLLEALGRHRITNLSAAATHYRMMKNCGAAGAHRYEIEKLSFTGEPIDSRHRRVRRADVRGDPRAACTGRPRSGSSSAAIRARPTSRCGRAASASRCRGSRWRSGTRAGRCPRPALRARSWFAGAKGGSRPGDLGRVDEDGWFYHAGRADDVILSAGWTMSAVEIEDALLRHPDVGEAAAIGAPDALRGAGGEGVRGERGPGGRRRLPGRAPGVRARTPRPARVSAADRVRVRVAQDAGRQGRPQGAPGARSGGTRCRCGRRRRCAPGGRPGP